ncbi:beta-ketoacyl synthase N-terminal-like domain-containing protein [Niallia sp. JL1B1071]|uniref:beta-ketoacyl synthase N-terminal-like domain-containing protein n=1 Tax=Niallia tiangongensis TaxID=3237105 RepID=UPI0037DD2EDD
MKSVITGMGIIGPGFSNINEYVNVLENTTCMLKQESYEGVYIYTGRVRKEQINQLDRKREKMSKPIQMILQACIEAIDSANIRMRDYRTAVIVGSSGGGIAEISNAAITLEKGGRISPYTLGNMNANSLSSSISSYFHLNGMSLSLANSCTSGIDALHLAKILIESNQVDVCIVGASEATICDTVLKGFLPLQSLQTGDKELPMYGPFSGGKGFSMSEGAGVLIVEKEPTALQRNVPILGVVEATSIYQDAVSPYQSDSTGAIMKQAVADCLKGKMPTYINSQALGIMENDHIEVGVYQGLFEESKIPITSIKGLVGHAMGTSPIFQIVSALISLRKNFIPATISPEINDYYLQYPIVKSVMKQKIDRVLITAHGYGGNNGCAMIAKGGA